MAVIDRSQYRDKHNYRGARYVQWWGEYDVQWPMYVDIKYIPYNIIIIYYIYIIIIIIIIIIIRYAISYNPYLLCRFC